MHRKYTHVQYIYKRGDVSMLAIKLKALKLIIKLLKRMLFYILNPEKIEKSENIKLMYECDEILEEIDKRIQEIEIRN